MGTTVPFHVFAILDGNRRWAEKEGLPRFMGHEHGYETLKQILPKLTSLGITHFTFWALSLNNLNRSKEEVQKLFELLSVGLEELRTSDIIKRDKIRMRFAGSFDSNYLPEEIMRVMKDTEHATRKNNGPKLTMLIAYDGEEEMRDAFQHLLRTYNRDADITIEAIRSALQTHYLPPMDLVIRTGGEPHMSAGMPLLHMRESYMYFTNTLWPDFTLEELSLAVTKAKTRERRNGK